MTAYYFAFSCNIARHGQPGCEKEVFEVITVIRQGNHSVMLIYVWSRFTLVFISNASVTFARTSYNLFVYDLAVLFFRHLRWL